MLKTRNLPRSGINPKTNLYLLKMLLQEAITRSGGNAVKNTSGKQLSKKDQGAGVVQNVIKKVEQKRNE